MTGKKKKIPKIYYENADNWYDKFIEKNLREIVEYLRNNGINTECSCEHRGYIQCQYILDGGIQHLHNLLFCYHHGRKLPINYEIIVNHKVDEGHSYTTLDIKLPELQKNK